MLEFVFWNLAKYHHMNSIVITLQINMIKTQDYYSQTLIV